MGNVYTDLDIEVRFLPQCAVLGDVEVWFAEHFGKTIRCRL